MLERLFEAGQADLTKLMQARQRLIQLENAQLDAVWQATQAQADLLLALGRPPDSWHAEPPESDDVSSTARCAAPAVASPTQGGSVAPINPDAGTGTHRFSRQTSSRSALRPKETGYRD